MFSLAWLPVFSTKPIITRTKWEIHWICNKWKLNYIFREYLQVHSQTTVPKPAIFLGQFLFVSFYYFTVFIYHLSNSNCSMFLNLLLSDRSERTSRYWQKLLCSKLFCFRGHISTFRESWTWAGRISISVSINCAYRDSEPKLPHILAVRHQEKELFLLCRHASCLTDFFLFSFLSFSCFSKDIHHQTCLYIAAPYYNFLPCCCAVQRANYVSVSAILM